MEVQLLGEERAPQTVEIIKTFGERCPDVTVTNQPGKANYVVTLDHEGGKGWLRHRNKVALFNRNGDVLFSHSTLTLGDSVKDTCEAIHNDLKNQFTPAGGAESKPTAQSTAQAALQTSEAGTVVVTSIPDGADVFADGAFVGKSPATFKLSAGMHSIRIAMKGYKDGSGDITVRAGSEVKLAVAFE